MTSPLAPSRAPGWSVRADGDPPPASARAGFAAATTAVLEQQLARVRVARVPLLFVATFQSVGILLLLRGVVDTSNHATSRQVVAGATVLVLAFTCLNLLAQRVGTLRANGGLDYYAAADVPGPAVVLGCAGAYASFAVPGAVVTAIGGAALFGLPYDRMWVLAAVLPLAAAALAGLGALLGLLAPTAELATIGGQLGMSAVVFLNLIPGGRLPLVVRWLRAAVPSTYATDAFAGTLRARVDWAAFSADLAVCAAVAVAALALAGAAFRRRVAR